MRAEFDPRVAYRAVLLALGLLAAGLLFEQLVQIVMLVTIAVVIAVPLAATASWLSRWGVPRAAGAVLALLAGAAVTGVLLAFVVPTFVSQVNDFIAQLPTTAAHFERTINNVLGLKRGTTTKAVTQFVNRYTHHPAVLLGPLAQIGVSIATILGAIVVVVISALYMAISPDPLVNGLVRLFPPPRQPAVRRTMERIRVAWLAWLRGVGLDMLVLGGLLFLGMEIIGLQFAAGFAIFSALMTVIPNYGSVISADPSDRLRPDLVVSRGRAGGGGLRDRQPDRGQRGAAAHHGPVGEPASGGHRRRSARRRIAVRHHRPAHLGAAHLVHAHPRRRAVDQAPRIGARSTRRSARRAGSRGRMSRTRGERAIYGAILLGAVLIAAGLVAQQLASLILATMLTVIVSLPMSVSAERLAPLGVPRALGAFIGLLAGIAVVAGALVLLMPPIIDQGRTLITDAPQLIRAAEIKLSSVTGDRPGHVAAELQHTLTTFVRDPSQLLGPITTIGASVATIIGGVVIGVITAYYIAAQPQPLTNGLLSLFSAEARPQAAATLGRIRAAWLGWLRGLAASMVLIGVMLYVALGLVVGLPFALVFAVLSACAEVVPYLGALASGIPPVAFALTISPTRAIVVLLVYVLVHQIEANVIGPLVMARAVRLHPAVIAIGVVAVGEVFGLLGLIVAVPILSLITILIDALWSGRHEPALILPD